MHIIEAYALACGLKIDKPVFVEEPYDGLPERFILFNPHSKGLSRFYSKWQEVLDDLSPKLKNMGIEIIHLDDSGQVYRGCKKIPTPKFNQTFFIVRKSMLLLGIDSFCMHVASALDKPMVILYAGNGTFAHSRPYFGDYSKYHFFVPNLGDQRPTYSFSEGQEFINQHDPNEIAEATLELIKET